MTENYILENQIARYKESGFDEESIAVAKEDLENNVSIEVVDTYMSVKLHKDNRLALADAFRKGMPLWLGKKIAAKERNYQKEVLSHIDERIPFEVMSGIIDECKTAKHVQVAFKNYREELIRIANGAEKTVEVQEPAVNPIHEPERHVDAETLQTNHIPATEPVSEEKPKKQKKEHVRTVFDQMPKKDPVPEEPHIPEVVVEKQEIVRPNAVSLEVNDKLVGLMQELIVTNKLMIETVLKSMNEETKKKEPDPIPRYVPNVIERIEEDRKRNAEKKEEKAEEKVEEKESPDPEETYKRMRAYAERSHSPAAPAFQPADGFVRMILMPDGSLHPVQVEVEKKKEPKGLMAFFSRMFGKGSHQEALINHLVRKKLSAEQLKMIHRAVRENLESSVIRRLIESDVSANEMDNMIDVLLADKNKDSAWSAEVV